MARSPSFGRLKSNSDRLKSLSFERWLGAGLVVAVFVAGPLAANAESVITAGIRPPQAQGGANGEPIRYVWQDGSQAILMIQRTKPYGVPVPFGVTESLCEDRNDRFPKNCTYHIANQDTLVELRWEKHPDASKVGQVVKVAYESTSSTPERLTLNQSRTASEQMVKMLPGETKMRDEISCDDFRWISGSKDANAPEEVVIPSWSGELMIGNGESGQNENRAYTGAYNLRLTRIDDHTMGIAGVGSFYSKFSGSVGIIGEVSAVVFRQTNGELCQATVKPNIGEAQRNFEMYRTKAAAEATFQPAVDVNDVSVQRALKRWNYNLTYSGTGLRFE